MAWYWVRKRLINAVRMGLRRAFRRNPNSSITNVQGALCKSMGRPARWKLTLKGYPVRNRVTGRGPDRPSTCDGLGVRTCWYMKRNTFVCALNNTSVDPEIQVWLLLRIMKYKCESFCLDLCIMRLFWAHSIPQASKSSKVPQSRSNLTKLPQAVWVHWETLCLNNSLTPPSLTSFSPPVCLPASDTPSPLPLKPPTHLPFPKWGY